MKLVVWNIRLGGGARVPRIVEELAAHDADVIAVTEYRAESGGTLGAALRERGWPHVETSGPQGKENGIAVFSSTPLKRLEPEQAPVEYRFRWLDVELPACGFGLCVLHIMAATNAATGKAKQRFWDAVLAAAETRVREPFLFAGSWNTGAHGLDERGKTFNCAEQFGRLAPIGWTDVWRRHHPGATEWTWYSNRGNGFRLDHAFASPGLLPRVRGCRYSHVEREAKVSDHSMTIVDVE